MSDPSELTKYEAAARILCKKREIWPDVDDRVFDKVGNISYTKNWLVVAKELQTLHDCLSVMTEAGMSLPNLKIKGNIVGVHK
jgi:hypothetical protein